MDEETKNPVKRVSCFTDSTRLRRDRTGLTAVALMAVVYFVFLTFFSLRAHWGLQTQMNDLGNADRSIWAAANGDWAMTQYNFMGGKPRSRLAGHANLIFWPLSLLYRVWDDPSLLLILTGLACAASGLGLYFLARHCLGSTWWACLPPAAFYLSPLTHDANLYDFHIITVSTAFLVWSIWAFSVRKPIGAWVLLALAMLCNEDVPLVTAMLGLHFVFTGKRRTGISIMVLSAAYFLAVMGLLVPFFNEGRLSESVSAQGSANRWDWVLKKPEAVIKTLTRPDRLRLPLYLLLSGACVAWRGRGWLLAVLPQVGIAMLSSTVWMTRLTGTYYWVTVEAVIIIACTAAARRPMNAEPRRFPWPLAYLGIATVIFSVLFSPLPHGIWSSWENYAVGSHRETLLKIAKKIPDNAAVSAQNNLGPHVSHREYITTFPRGYPEGADHILLHLRNLGGPDTGMFGRSSQTFMHKKPAGEIAGIAKLLAMSPKWGLMAQKDGFYLFGWEQRGVMDKKEALSRIREDEIIFKKSVDESRKHRTRFADFAIGELSWSDLF